jgi:hypothetical protein
MPVGAESQRQLAALIPVGARCRLSGGDDPKDLRSQDRALVAAIDRTGTRSGPGVAIAGENARLDGGRRRKPSLRRCGTGALPFATRS